MVSFLRKKIREVEDLEFFLRAWFDAKTKFFSSIGGCDGVEITHQSHAVRVFIKGKLCRSDLNYLLISLELLGLKGICKKRTGETILMIYNVYVRDWLWIRALSLVL